MASGDGGTQHAGQHRVGLVVIHGVGETEPGYAVNTLLETLSNKVADYNVSQFSAFQRSKRVDIKSVIRAVSPQEVPADGEINILHNFKFKIREHIE